MLSKVLGYLWIFLGVICAAKPSVLRGWLSRKTDWRLFWALLFIFIVVFFQLLGIVWRLEGDLPKVLGVIGIIFLLRAGWKVQSRARGRLAEWLGGLPLGPFQVFGWFLIAIGVSLVYFGAVPKL